MLKIKMIKSIKYHHLVMMILCAMVTLNELIVNRAWLCSSVHLCVALPCHLPNQKNLTVLFVWGRGTTFCLSSSATVKSCHCEQITKGKLHRTKGKRTWHVVFSSLCTCHSSPIHTLKAGAAAQGATCQTGLTTDHLLDGGPLSHSCPVKKELFVFTLKQGLT